VKPRDQVIVVDAGRTMFGERFARAKEEGDFPPDTDAEGLATFLTAVNQGMSVQAGAGATRAELERLVETSLKLWPGR